MRDLAQLQRWAKYTVETWTTPEQFKTPEEFAQALTEVLDEMALAYGQQPPVIEGVWK